MVMIPRRRAGAGDGDTPLASVLVALVRGVRLDTMVPLALEHLERDPLVRASRFHGDLLRGLMEMPGTLWGRRPEWYDRYRDVLRRSASLRRRLPPDERMKFWTPLSIDDEDSGAINEAPGTTRALPRDG